MQRSILRLAVVMLCLTVVGCGQADLATGDRAAGDGAAGTANPVTEPDSAIPESSIVVDGRLVPKTWVRLAFVTGGTVAEVLVNPGDTVARGASLVRLDTAGQAEAAVVTARAELLAARQARQVLEDQLPAERARALQALAAARQSVRDAEMQVTYLESESPGSEADRVDAQLVQAEAALNDAEAEFADYADEDPEDLTRARLQIALADAQLAYHEAVRAAELHTESEWRESLDLARSTLLAAQLQLGVAQDLYDSLTEGGDPDAILAADARVEAADSQLAAAEENLAALTLHAPVAGTVVQVDVKVGEPVGPTVPAVVLADLSEWWIETDNLTQIDVIAIEPGHEASVVVDAIPDLMLTGEVVSIDRLFQEKRGEVTYTAHLRLDGTDPRLRWGMPCALTFAAP
jgi:HlyD family secretion protein